MIRRYRGTRWTPEVIARLGKEPDRAIADDLGLTVQAVQRVRAKLGIAPQPYYQPLSLGAAMALGTMSDRAFARRYRVSPRRAKKEREARSTTRPDETPGESA